MIGKTVWAIGDGYMNSTANGKFESHEALCVLNVSGVTAHIKITIYFADREPITGFTAECGNNRTNHIRLDWIKNPIGETVPHDTPYAALLESDTPIVVQHSRMDVSQPEMTLMTKIAY